MEMTEQINEIAGALALAQSEIESAAKDRINPHFKQGYATLASVWDACRKPLSKNGLSVSQFPKAEGKTVTLTTMLLHKSGQWFREILVMEAMNGTPQAVGSAITYARRYALASMVGVAPDDDDDGNAGSGRQQQNPQQEREIQHYETQPPAESEEIKTAWRKLRAGANKSFSAAKSMAEYKDKQKAFAAYSGKGDAIWSQLTHHNADETFGALADSHRARIEGDEELASPAGIIRWIEAVTKSDMKGLVQRISEYRSKTRLQTPQCEQALDDQAVALGFPAYQELESQEEAEHESDAKAAP